MTEVPIEMESLRLEIPEPLLNYDWDKLIDANQGEIAKSLEVLKMQCQFLENCRNWSTTPESLTWILLWTRNFNLLQSTASILASDVNIIKAGQEFSLGMLWRPTFEFWITLNFILNENAALQFDAKENEDHTLEHRLCAYLAWCLWNDKELAHKKTQGWRLDAIFGDRKAQMSEVEKEQVSQWGELLWGDEIAVDLEEDQKVKRLVRMESLNDRNQLRKWLQDQKLHNFEKYIRTNRPMNYFELVAPENRSLAAVLRSINMDAAYSGYQEGSVFMHGSSFLNHVEHVSNHIYPGIISSDDAIQKRAANIRRHCHFNAITIGQIQERMEVEDLV